MLKKILVAAALAAPTLAFAGNTDIVIRVGGPGQIQFRPAAYNYGSGEQYRMTRWVNQEQESQRQRIAQGIRSGELTRQEVQRLQHEQEQIRAMERRYLANNHLSSREFANLREELREAGTHIRAQKTDRQDRDNRQYAWR